MQNAPIDTGVLIIGAGPVGLFLANECARRQSRNHSGTTPGIKLVRPDGYIAFSAQNCDNTAALESMRSLLQRQTN